MDTRTDQVTIDATRDALGRLPVAEPGEPVCGNLCTILGEHAPACQATFGHESRCRFYDDDDGFVEWVPRDPFPIVILGQL